MTMQVTNVRVSFLREKQPAQYEKAAPAVEFSAVLEDGEDHRAATRALMISAAEVVYNAIGYDVPDRVQKALAGGAIPAELSVDTKTAEPAAETVEAAEEAPETAEATPEADKPKKRGRPKGSKNTAPKKGTAAAKKAAEAEVPGEDDGVPGDEPSKDAISTGDARVGPDDDATDHGAPGDDDVPGSEESGDPVDDSSDEFTPKDLHALIMSHVNATPRTLSVANAKQILAHFKVARAQDLTNEQALEGKAMVEKMVEAVEGPQG
jgi:hypothetical protein